jgi:hypothetical protein
VCIEEREREREKDEDRKREGERKRKRERQVLVLLKKHRSHISAQNRTWLTGCFIQSFLDYSPA